MKPPTTWTVPARILRVIDGDTIECDLDLGWHITYRAKVRIAGINAPEMSVPAGAEARAYLIHLLGWRTGTEPVVTITSRSLDKYGRVLADVIITGTDSHGTVYTHVGQALVAAGHAVQAA
jgi:micrococcal nuclease